MTIDDLKDIQGYCYLASAYSKWEDKELAATIVEKAAASLMNRGLVIYAPICHGHAVAKHGLPYSWDFWKRQCQPMIDAAAAMIVLKMDGWEESVGVQYEIGEFERTGKPVVYLEVDECVTP
jgi:hypothetical protein